MTERAGRTKFQNSEFKIGREFKTRETSNQKFDDTVFSYKESDKKYIIKFRLNTKQKLKKLPICIYNHLRISLVYTSISFFLSGP